MQNSSVLRAERIRKLIALQQRTSTAPYSIVHRLKLAQAYRDLGYPDLAVGDAYKALLLVDEVLEDGEYHEEALDAARLDYASEQLACASIEDSGNDTDPLSSNVTDWAKGTCLKEAYFLLIEGLQRCGCLRSTSDYTARAKKAFPGDLAFEHCSDSLTQRVCIALDIQEKDLPLVDIHDYPEKGLVRREQYPWNHHEPDRFSEPCLQFLNEQLADIAPKLEVRASDLPVLTQGRAASGLKGPAEFTKQLGLFAREDIPPGQQILEEKSLLTAVSRFHESYCDACSIPLPNAFGDATTSAANNSIITCNDCDEVYFCSEECHDLAQESYHPSVCGMTVDQGTIPASEAADHLYTLLLVRALALAETQQLHPLELKELRYIWGDYHGCDLETTWQMDSLDQPEDLFGNIPRTLPFSFKSNILMPLHVLEKMDINVFTETDRYDAWIFNTLYAKFRGTASARQGLDGKPDTSAVHPMWCLANHSCDPNVAWDWQGTMRFWTRDQRIDWAGRNPEQAPGLKKGEEVFGHYCDVRLPVKERREWAVGALGGDCMCARCVWEEEEETRRNVAEI
ncbi:hypothetical protein T440DRAFT_6980 [Plenodomus tracheiphilus IPT5]|uniref:SET domain-containing protein n=1 Tax=Plenodomus tracheiphilus IPT5 TaxID=1408161 RepID=A0A6A7BPX7_9PLEO|nr:hypothetical protein T440DRAFT_6980 [Plenodomus tracheiphilus IPT5]